MSLKPNIKQRHTDTRPTSTQKQLLCFHNGFLCNNFSPYTLTEGVYMQPLKLCVCLGVCVWHMCRQGDDLRNKTLVVDCSQTQRSTQLHEKPLLIRNCPNCHLKNEGLDGVNGGGWSVAGNIQFFSYLFIFLRYSRSLYPCEWYKILN